MWKVVPRTVSVIFGIFFNEVHGRVFHALGIRKSPRWQTWDSGKWASIHLALIFTLNDVITNPVIAASRGSPLFKPVYVQTHGRR